MTLFHRHRRSNFRKRMRLPNICSPQMAIFGTVICFHLIFYVFSCLVTITVTHWGRVTHICVGNLNIIGPDNGFSPGRRQAIIWTNDGILLIWPWGTNFGKIFIGIQAFPFMNMHLKMSFVKWRPFSRPQCVKRLYIVAKYAWLCMITA